MTQADGLILSYALQLLRCSPRDFINGSGQSVSHSSVDTVGYAKRIFAQLRVQDRANILKGPFGFDKVEQASYPCVVANPGISALTESPLVSLPSCNVAGAKTRVLDPQIAETLQSIKKDKLGVYRLTVRGPPNLKTRISRDSIVLISCHKMSFRADDGLPTESTNRDSVFGWVARRDRGSNVLSIDCVVSPDSTFFRDVRNRRADQPIFLRYLHCLNDMRRFSESVSSLTANEPLQRALESYTSSTPVRVPPMEELTLETHMAFFRLNESQKEACRRACNMGNNTFTLIQSPPGTEYHNLRLATAIVDHYAQLLDGGDEHKRVLVCAPTNTAVQNVMRALMLVLDQQQSNCPSEHIVLAYSKGDDEFREWLATGQAHRCVVAGNWHAQRREVYANARVVFCTAVAAGNLRDLFSPDVVLIDDAARMLESQALIPLSLGATKVVVMGDPLQPPAAIPTCLMEEIDPPVSLFERLLDVGYGDEVLTLQEQCRMDPRIASFRSFDTSLSGGGVTNDACVCSDTMKWENKFPYLLRSDHCHRFGFTPTMLLLLDSANFVHLRADTVRFFDVRGQEERPDGKSSFLNELEAEEIIKQLEFLLSAFPESQDIECLPSIGIVSFYREQNKLLQKKVRAMLRKFGEDAQLLENRIHLCTIGSDIVQNYSFDIALLSLVRTRDNFFVADTRRLNVALTRANHMLAIFGHADALCNSREPGYSSARKEAKYSKANSGSESYGYVWSELLNRLGGARDSSSGLDSFKTSLDDFIN
ncbi:MAG: hypothetical protein MHM6MM_005969 [Cercozoa sp. M6MM]